MSRLPVFLPGPLAAAALTGVSYVLDRRLSCPEFFRRHFKVMYAQGPIALFEVAR